MKFSNELERINERAFYYCISLERITIPLKDGVITYDDTFQECAKLNCVDLVEGELHETIAALQIELWRVDMYQQIDAINQILPTADAGDAWDDDENVVGEKALTIRAWMRSVLGKINEYNSIAAYWMRMLRLPSCMFYLKILLGIVSFLFSSCHHMNLKWEITKKGTDTTMKSRPVV